MNRLEIPLKICIVAALLPAAALAQGQLPHPAVASEPVPRVIYRSVFVDIPTGIEKESADWKKANAAVGQFRRGHVDILKSESDAARRSAPAATPPGRSHHHGSQP